MEIMSAYTSRLVKICGFGFGLALSTSGLIAADLVLQKVPPLTVEQAPAYPQNLARYECGAQVEAAPQSPIANLHLNSKLQNREATLLCADSTVDYALPSGKTTLLVSLSKIENIDKISFLNGGAKGNLTIATANAKLPTNSPQWHDVSNQELTPDSVKAKIGPAEAKYVRLTFDVTQSGHIAGLGVYSAAAAVSDFTMPRSRKSANIALVGYNVTDLHAKARALYVSSGDDLKQANNMIDDQPATSYNFAANDATPTAVVDLGKPTALRRISAVYSSRQGSVDFYVLQSLPSGEMTSSSDVDNSPRTLRVNDVGQKNLQPVGSVTDNGTGRAAIDFPVTTGRYIMVKWNSTVQQDTSFSVAEIAAFGGANQSANLMASNASGTGRNEIESDGKTIQDGKDAKDSKDIPAEGPEPPAEGPPPSLPDPPPFTFVPEILPNSE
jgi:hypothetical protein